MNRAILSVKGIRIPMFWLWLLGVIHGRFLHSAAIDPDSETITSGYIVKMIKRFFSACVVRADFGRQNLKKAWVEAEYAMTVIDSCGPSPAEEQTPLTNGECGSKAREKEREARQRTEARAERENAIRKLTVNKSIILDELIHAQNQADATAERLLSLFSAYANGALRKPVRQRDLPELPRQDMAARILASPNDVESGMEDAWRRILDHTKEEVSR